LLSRIHPVCCEGGPCQHCPICWSSPQYDPVGERVTNPHAPRASLPLNRDQWPAHGSYARAIQNRQIGPITSGQGRPSTYSPKPPNPHNSPSRYHFDSSPPIWTGDSPAIPAPARRRRATGPSGSDHISHRCVIPSKAFLTSMAVERYPAFTHPPRRPSPTAPTSLSLAHTTPKHLSHPLTDPR